MHVWQLLCSVDRTKNLCVGLCTRSDLSFGIIVVVK